MNEDSSLGFTALAFALAVVGGTLGALLGTSHRRLCALISLGAGTLMGVTLFAILPETFSKLNWWELLLGLASGYFVFSLISKYVFHVCPACAASHFDEATTHRFSEIASAMMLALAIHCTVDGLALSAGSEAESPRPAAVTAQGQPVAAAPTKDPAADHAATDAEKSARAVVFSIILAVCVHKIPEGLALGALLRGAGLTTKAILWRVIAVEATTLLGGLIGLIFFPQASPFWVAIALAHAGGGFIFLGAHAIVGEIIKHHKTLVLSCFGGGVAVIGLFVLFLHFF